MRIALCAALAGSAATLGGCMTYGDDYDAWAGYDYNRPDPSYNGYYPERYYRQGDYYVMTRGDRIYRARDGRYYCRRSNGTTGLIVGGITGGVLGNIIAPGDSRTLGTILGAAGGAIVGRSIDRNNIVCR